ncbi:hypothetical protein PHYPSEUDO_008007 [Phytophthora pseudosyringae]|uniref:AGC protein kinase n=1 Tax=Phytophthora pseudosyringae TaxID=221518 RepID=A0A8T1VIE3_9STRA|nr:hypothetical protein PHYPSEUDO_008007 [Phytophthora pseudosyringae]
MGAQQSRELSSSSDGSDATAKPAVAAQVAQRELHRQAETGVFSDSESDELEASASESDTDEGGGVWMALPSALTSTGRTFRRIETQVVDEEEQLQLVKRRARAARKLARNRRKGDGVTEGSEGQRGSDGDAISSRDFQRIKVIGVGGMGRVLLVRHRRDGKLYAMKVVSKKSVKEKEMAARVLSERDVLGGTCHDALAPEIFKGREYGTAADWWAFGAVLYELLTGLPPWYSQNAKEMCKQVLHTPLSIPDFISPEAEDLLRKLLSRNPYERLGSLLGGSEIKEHAFFRRIDWDMVTFRETRAPFQPCASPETIVDGSNFRDEFTKIALGSIDSPVGGAAFSESFKGFNFKAPEDQLIEYGYTRDVSLPSNKGDTP